MRRVPAVLLLCMLGGVASGCRYLQNRADDLGDIFQFGAGGTTAADAPFPPGIGAYVEATEFLHFGGMAFSGVMAEIDRRGSAITHVREDYRWGFGPFHKWHRDEVYGPADRYKGGEMPTWEERMETKSYETCVLSDRFGRTAAAARRRHRGEPSGLRRHPAP